MEMTPPETVCAVDGYCSNWARLFSLRGLRIRPEIQTNTAGNESDNDRSHGIYESRGRGDSHKPGEQAVAAHRRVWLVVANPHVQHCRKRTRLPASMVFTAIDPIRKLPLPEAPSVEPGLNPNQPNARMKQPVSTMTMSCARMAFDFPVRSYLPIRGPSIIATANAVIPPTECTTPEPAKSQ